MRESSLPSTTKVKLRKEEITMSKLVDMAAAIEDLRTAAAAINDAANWLAEMFSGKPA
ncbi:MAG: hypothetical protein ACI305_01620 [Lepagella sp.]